ncbi:MAG: glutathione binding-like protein [Steroidobacteraceae bacterium]
MCGCATPSWGATLARSCFRSASCPRSAGIAPQWARLEWRSPSTSSSSSENWASGPTLVGNSFTLADVAYLPFLQFLAMLEVPVGPHLKAWAERVLARPSALATVPAR